MNTTSASFSYWMTFARLGTLASILALCSAQGQAQAQDVDRPILVVAVVDSAPYGAKAALVRRGRGSVREVLLIQRSVLSPQLVHAGVFSALAVRGTSGDVPTYDAVMRITFEADSATVNESDRKLTRRLLEAPERPVVGFGRLKSVRVPLRATPRRAR